jgi:hypothetical protein
MDNVFRCIALFLLLSVLASAQEEPMALPFSRSDMQSEISFRLSSPLNATFGGNWFAGIPWFPTPERTLAQQLFTQEMLRKAMEPDPNRSVRNYKSDARYYRMVTTTIAGPSRVSPGPTKSSFLNDLISSLYVGMREKYAGRHLSAIDYMTLPNNTGMITSFQDSKEKAWMQGEEQADELRVKIDLRAWPYARSADSLKLKALLGL